ncbi:glycerol-3-phosphate acyltransferase [candidate division WOR-3 bacterium]|nr:glycerol-3-phosphate acyltransferase [candidate division WOR-3 bacterium]MCK4334645.1 glycerol-3-phosphate acyltransferase [candidate division WOR-3 bacterium]
MSVDLLKVFLWTGVGFLSGSMMFSVWMGKLLLKKDVRAYGDANPGAANVWKAGGWKIGLPAGILELWKGAVPVGLAHWAFGIEGWYLVPVALAPILGHAFSPFLGFKGGKAVAVTLGVWTGITLWEGIGVLGILMGVFFILQTVDSWAIILAMLAFLGYLLFLGLFVRGVEIPLLAIWAGNMAIFLYKHRVDLRESIKPRPYIARLFRRAS